ncbi:MAG: DNA gyrase subunit A [bacterium ADurb.Bin400]|nr:MAG: DNA gyrase subunit A [bacterium ADurb.Bin400]
MEEDKQTTQNEHDLDHNNSNNPVAETAQVEEHFDPAVGRLKPRDLSFEMETSYLDYAMSVIVSRALPDVRDGLKPVHRRVIYAMHDTGLTHSAKYRKSAKVVGEVIGNYHPHGDMAVYDTLVRLAQDFSMRYPLVDGQGNFGSMDGDSAAAMRYTECRMTAIAGEMVADIDKDTVNWQDNYDGSTKEPVVLPARVPQLLLNGAMGIAVGMATNIPPHNLKELCDGVIHLIDHPDATSEDLMNFIKGPDFPTGGNIYNTEDIKTAYVTGKGRIMMRAKADIEETKRGFRIVIHEIPYQVNKASMIEKIADLVKNKKIDGISDIRDESDRHGVRVVVELKANSYPRKVLNKLYETTPMQTAFHVNMLALTPELEPRVMTLKDIIAYYIAHRQEVIERRTRYELKKAKDRAHILEGLKIALDHIDEVISTIRSSANRDEAHANLVAKFGFSSIQANAILDMRLSSLAALERKKIEEEYEEILKLIAYLEDLLAHPEKILGVIKADLREVSKKYGDDRRTDVIPHALGEFRAEDLIPDEQVIVSLSRSNYVKRQDVNTYKKQVRGGVGVVGMTTKEEDIVDHLICANTHDDVYFFTDQGRVFKSKIYELPATSRLSKGTPIVNIVQLSQQEKVTAVLTIPKNNTGQKYFIMGTTGGQIKKTEIEKYDNIRKSGIIAMGLSKDDELKWVKTSSGEDVIVEVSQKGQAICYHENDVRPMGRSASGVTGMKLRSGDRVMSMDVVSSKYFDENASKKELADMLIVLENGFGKRTKLNLFHVQKRSGYGVRAVNCTAKTGNVIGMHISYSDDGDVVLASQKGQFIRMSLSKIKRLGRDTQGVTLMRLRDADKVASVALILPNGDSDSAEQTNLFGDDQDLDDNDSPASDVPGDKSANEIVQKKTSKKSKNDQPAIAVHHYVKESEAASPAVTEVPRDITTTSAQLPNTFETSAISVSDTKTPARSNQLHIQSYSDKVVVDEESPQT